MLKRRNHGAALKARLTLEVLTSECVVEIGIRL